MSKLLLVDGSNLLFQMFYGMPSRIFNKAGKPIHGTLGFVGALLKIIRKIQPDYALVVFDGEHHNERRDVDPDYKSNRMDYSQMAEEETPFSQLPDICAALDYLGIKRMETTTCETDDIVASYALRYGKEMQIVVSSLDSDFFQLINENVRVLRYRGDNTLLCDVEYIRNKFGISPESYADFKSLTGDTADNIKGACNIGPKTAAALLSEFGSLEEIFENVENIKKPSVKASIKQSVAQLRKNQRLIKLDGSAPRPFELGELHFSYNGVTTSEVLTKIGVR